jgi:hypothetical protein
MTTDKTRSAKGKKPNGYWNDPANVIAEAKALVEEHGPEALNQKWLSTNGHSGLSNAISKHGGFVWIRAELGLGQVRKPSGYWEDPANVIAEAKSIVEEHGPEALTYSWLAANAYTALTFALNKHGGYAWIRAELGLAQGQKLQGYWRDPANVIAEARAIVEEHGPGALTASWLEPNGYSSLSIAIIKHGGVAWIRAELGLEQGRKPQGYWKDSANVIAEARAVVEKYGPEALNQSWLAANGHSGLANALSKHGSYTWIRAGLGLGQGKKPNGYWGNPATVITEAQAIVEEHGPEAMAEGWLRASGRSSLANAIATHGGLAWIRAELGLEQSRKPVSYWENPATVITEAKAIIEENGPDALTAAWLIANGYSTMSYAIGKHGGFYWIWAELGVEAPARPSFGDSVQNALDCTGRHSQVRDCDFYIYGLANFSGFVKPGIAFDTEDRARSSKGQYGEQHFSVTFATRQEAFFFEQAVLDATRGCAHCPEELLDWAGATEVRTMDPADLIQVADRLLAELEELGVWEFAARFVPMTAAQRAICQQRALTGAPACAETAAL